MHTQERWLGCIPFLGLTLVLAVVLAPRQAAADAGAPPCSGELELVEIYAGDANCPNAQYAVFKGDLNKRENWGSYHVVTRDHCGLAQKRIARVRHQLTLGSKDSTTLLVGTTAAQALFGIKMDVVARPVIEPRDGSISLRCGSTLGSALIYGGFPAAFAPALAAGKALRRVGKQWRQVDPKPTNSFGMSGQQGSCPASGGVPRIVPPAPTAYPLCDQPVKSSPPAGVVSTAGPKKAGLPPTPKSGWGCGCILASPRPPRQALAFTNAALLAALLIRRRRRHC